LALYSSEAFKAVGCRKRLTWYFKLTTFSFLLVS
jgi:hypothetical protein